MAELAGDASSSDGLCATLETYVYSSDAGENEVQDEPIGEEPALKWCTACKTHKPLAGLCKDVSKRDGKNKSCRVCHRAWNNRRKERKEVEDDAEGARLRPRTKSHRGSEAGGTTSTSSRTAASQSTRSGGRPTLRRAAMGCRSRKTSTYRR